MILRLNQSQRDKLREEIAKVYPIEACALLFGTLTPQEAIVKKVVITPNESHSPTRFEINPVTVINEYDNAEEEGLDFVGIFHSHPAPATPSPIDLTFMKYRGYTLWLIFSSLERKFAAFQLINGKIREVSIEITL